MRAHSFGAGYCFEKTSFIPSPIPSIASLYGTSVRFLKQGIVFTAGSTDVAGIVDLPPAPVARLFH